MLYTYIMLKKLTKKPRKEEKKFIFNRIYPKNVWVRLWETVKIQELHSLHLQMSCNQLDWYGFLGWPDQQADGVLRASRPTLADGQNKGGLEQWRREEEGLAGRWGDQGAARRTASRLCSSVGF